MRLATILENGREVAVLVDPARGVVRAADLDPTATGTLLDLIRQERVTGLSALADAAPDELFQDRQEVTFTAPYRHPRLIWGIGLNYRDHASDLSESVPEEPASFIKGDHTVIGPGEPIPVPPQSERTTSEAEMGLVIGRYCRNVTEEEALDHVLGVVPVLDQTAEDLRRAYQVFADAQRSFPEALQDLDVLITPSAPGEAPKGLEWTGDPGFNFIWTSLHVPCVTVPAGTGPNGLPLGIQIVGRHGEDRAVLTWARWVQAALD